MPSASRPALLEDSRQQTRAPRSSPSAPPTQTTRTSRWTRASGPRTDLLQQLRKPPVLQHPPARLLLRAVAHDVVLEVDRLDLRAAARAGLARAPVHLERHRQLVGDRVADHLLVVLERPAEHLVAGQPQPLPGVVVELRPLLKRRQPGGPEQLVHPRATDARDRAL